MKILQKFYGVPLHQTNPKPAAWAYALIFWRVCICLVGRQHYTPLVARCSTEPPARPHVWASPLRRAFSLCFFFLIFICCFLSFVSFSFSILSFVFLFYWFYFFFLFLFWNVLIYLCLFILYSVCFWINTWI
jgi:hypothetical protein